ncbi:MAG TPA: acetyl-CoA carboxylase biotin carboxyl carrier protein [Chitinophagaceae bacterium]|nr:acetyl-CoA carboxylase biotin carboxyl carrier protein [Chitinophagaceae bacterium]
MDFKQIQELVRLVNKSSINELTIEEDKFKITIKREQRADESHPMTSPENYRQVVQQMVPVVPANSPSAQSEAALPADNAPAKEIKENLVTIKSPMIGTFYRSQGPDKGSFVNVGDEVAPGKVVCIIEAMKLFNEIESEVSGKIVKVLVEDASPVEYDQPLFLVEP